MFILRGDHMSVEKYIHDMISTQKYKEYTSVQCFSGHTFYCITQMISSPFIYLWFGHMYNYLHIELRSLVSE